MQVMGSIQWGLSLLSALPEKWPLIVIDIKDGFFFIPLDLKDSVRFAFTLPSCDHKELDQRFEWVVLPQGRSKSPIMCQLYVGKTLEPIKNIYPKLRCVHYILLAAKDKKYLQEAYGKMVESLRQWGLHIAPEKVQQEKIVSCLGTRIAPTAVWPQKIQLRVDSLHTLFQILKRDSELSSEREITPEARKALTLVKEELIKAQLQRCREGLPIILIILPTEVQPTGLLWQEGPLLWIHSKMSAGRTLDHYPTTVASLALLGIQHCLQYFGIKPNSIVIPYDRYQQKVLTANIDEWAILACINEGTFDNHYPKHPLMTFFKEHSVIFP